MKRSLFILALYSLLSSCFGELFGQSFFEDYSTSITTLDAAPYASLSLDAMDYNPAGNVFLRNGFELSLSSLWPRWQLIENENTFKVRDYEVNRTCKEYSKWGVPNPSARLSYRNDNWAIAFSYAHGESRYEGDGNTYYDDVVQKELSDDIIQALDTLSVGFFRQNHYANLLSRIISILYNVNVSAPYADGTEFPMSIMSSSIKYGCVSDRFSIGYSRRINIGHNEKWEYVSFYGGVKTQRMALYSTTELGLFIIEQNDGTANSFPVFCDKFADYYRQLADSIPGDMSEYFTSMRQSYENMAHFADSAFSAIKRSCNENRWGGNVELGFNYIRPYWNVAAKMELGCLPFKFSLGSSHYFGQWQLSTGINVGYAIQSRGEYSRLFRQRLDGGMGEHWYGDVGAGVACSIPHSYWTLKGGVSCGVNKDVLLSNGYGFFLVKHNTLSPSLSFKWNASSLLMLVGGVRVDYPIGKKEFDMEGSFDSGAVCKLKPDYQASIGFVAHLE